MAARHDAKSKVSAKAPKKAPKKAAAAGTTRAPSTKTPAKKAAPVKKAAARTTRASSAKPAKKTAAKKTAAKKAAAAGPRLAPAAKPTTKAAAPVKGLRGIQGGKAARIAQIVAESFLPPAGTTHAPSPAAPAAADETLRVAHRIAAELFAKKAEDVVLMDLRNLSTVADYYLIATCRNEPQMRALLGGVQRALSREGVKSLRSEYMPGVRWAVVDFGDIILHLFEKQTRGFYSLERLWADAPATTLRAEDYAAADAEEAGERTADSHDDL